MVWGMSLETFTLVHVLISLVGIVTGFVVLLGWLAGRDRSRWTALFLVTTILTSVTGFGFPFDHLLPSHKLAILSLVMLAVALVARYALHLGGAWRWIYVVTATIALYFNFFVLIVQSFEKVPALKALAPQQSEPPFVVSQVIALLAFIVFGTLAVRRFKPKAAAAAQAKGAA